MSSSLCRCTDDAAERWPLATPVVDPVRRAALELRVNLYALGAVAHDAPDAARFALALALTRELAAWPEPDRAAVLRVLGATGLAVPLAHAVVRQALAAARERVALGRLRRACAPLTDTQIAALLNETAKEFQ